MTNVVSFLKQRLASSLGLPWQKWLAESELERMLAQHQAQPKRERLLYALGDALLLAIPSAERRQKL
jgi:hypothetical protein